MSRRAELEQFVIREAVSEDGIPVLIRMGTDPGRPRMKELNAALGELERLLEGERVLDRRFAYALYALAYYVSTNVDSWLREGREWPAEFVDEELDELLMHVESILDGGLFVEELDGER
jgi:hypothetical protein